MKSAKILAAVIAGACMLTITSDLSAQRGGKRVEKIFKRLDANNDGKITKDEAGERWARLSKADANEDGGVTLDELKAAMSKRKRRRKKK